MIAIQGMMTGAAAAQAGPGVSRALAESRAMRVSEPRYSLSFQVQAGVDDVGGAETITFDDRGQGDLLLDYRDGAVASAMVNGRAIGTELVDGHLVLPAVALRASGNEVRIAFTSHAGAAGKAITRYKDRDDGNEYVYTLFVPMDASMAFPCFDQPDLKGRFRLSVSHPAGWTVIGNGTPETSVQGGAHAETVFAETLPISTYLFAFAAGPWAKIEPGGAGEPAMYVRRSQLARARSEAPQVQAMTARGVAWLSAYFAQPFPFPKYELVLIPGFPFGGMEHAGATFLNEDGVLFRTAPTASDFFRRNTLVLHETCHQWFGDLVTMRWFDDLWLKEGFAQYMAYKALAALEPESQPWKYFYEDVKPLAYGIDETGGTTPIYQNIPNLKDAKSAYGAIVYQKAPSVLKQLNYFVGEENFRAGLRLYLKQHAYGNAQWADLVGALEATGTSDVRTWADAWIPRRGMPEVEVSWACAAGKIRGLTLRQKDVLGDGLVWPISNEVLLGYGDSTERVAVSWKTAQHAVMEAVGRPCPRFVFANAGDEAYGRFLLDAGSAGSISHALEDGSGPAKDDPLLRTMLWGALWENVRTARIAPLRYVELARPALLKEEDESLSRIQGSRVATALHAYLGPRAKASVLEGVEEAVLARMTSSDTVGLRIVNFRTFTSIAETPRALGVLRDVLSGSVKIEGMPLRPLDRWNVIGHLIAMKDPQASALFAEEMLKDRSGEGQKYAYAVEAGTPDAQVKSRYFAEYVSDPGSAGARQEDWITQSLRSFNSWNQAGLTKPYLLRALDALPQIKQKRKIFFLGAWLGAFLDGQQDAEAQAAVHAWLARARIDPDLRLKVLEAVDGLDRTVMIRRRFPE